jgi:hypothetical protein
MDRGTANTRRIRASKPFDERAYFERIDAEPWQDPFAKRRNVFPDSYRRLPKQEKRQARAAAEWIWKMVSRLDWGRKMPDRKAGKPVPKPVNLKEQTAHAHPPSSVTSWRRIASGALRSYFRMLEFA